MSETWNDDPSLLPELSGRPRTWLRALWVTILLGYAVAFAVGLDRIGLKDHDMFLVFHEIQCWNQEFFGLDRQWTPQLCGGLSAAGNPQIPVLSPYALAGYVVGPFWGLRLVAILYFVLGFVSAYLYAGLWLRNREARALAAALFIGNGYFVCRFSYGHVTFLAFLLLPALLWAFHRVGPWVRATPGWRGAARRLFAVLLFGAVLALLLDGNPHTIVYLLPWLGVYALALAVVRRSFAPLFLFAGATLVAGVLDAAYLWPLVDAQWTYPRLREDEFTNPLALLFFLVVPFRGSMPVFETPSNGYEFSVFTGIVVVYALVRHGRALLGRMPRELRVPIVATSIVFIVLGVGSLKPLGVPTALSPFDLLRPLPGFRSIGVTARYWGFLALPLSLIGSAALWRFVAMPRRPAVLAAWLIAALGFQLGYQVGTIVPKLVGSRVYERKPTEGLFAGRAERITYREREHEKIWQGEYITPVTGVTNCMDGSEFLRPPMDEGPRLVREVQGGGLHAGDFEGRFRTWSHIELEARAPSPAPSGEGAGSEMRIVLNQAWHAHWSTGVGRIERGEERHLVVVVGRDELERAGGRIELAFHDEVSARGTAVSLVAWPLALAALVCLLPFALRPRTRTRAPAA